MKVLEIYFVDVESGQLSEVPLTQEDLELLEKQMARCVEYGGTELFARWLGQAFSVALPEAVDYDLKAPSDAQVAFATAIARVLRLPIAPEVLRYRGPMHEFLALYKDQFNARKTTRTKSRKSSDGMAADLE